MDSEVRAGVLYVQKGLVKKFQKKYVALYRRSQHGVSRLEVYDSKENFDKRLKGAKKHLISLDSCATINRTSVPDGKKKEYNIHLTFDGSREQTFQAESDEDMELWYASMSSVIFGGGGLTDNVIYQQFEDNGYDVVIKQNEIAKKLNLSGLYTLLISAEDVELRDKQTKKAIFKWPLDRLRKYGRDKQEFSLEAGRRCPTGAGMFYFITDHYNEIFQEVDRKVRSLAKNRDIRDRATSVSSMNDFRPPTFGAGPPSPLVLSPPPASPFSKGESVYDNPLDEVRRPAAVTQEPIYNDPIDTGRPSTKAIKTKDKKPSSPKKGAPAKSQQAQPKKSGGKKDKKKKGAPKNLPPSPAPPAVHIAEATYSSALPIAGSISTADDGGGAYGKLDFEGTKRFSNTSGEDNNQYDSLDVRNNSSTTGVIEESEYATTESITPRFSQMSAGNKDDVYNSFQRS